MKRYQKLINSFVFAVLFSGCATKRENVSPPNSFFTKKSTITVAQISGLKPCYAMYGEQGLLGCIVNENMSRELAKKVEKIDPKPIVDEYYYKRYEKTLMDKGFKVVSNKNPINEKELQRIESDDGKLAPYDFKPLKRKYNTEYALILVSEGFGVFREYRSMFPVSEPMGFADLRMYLINLSDNSIVSEYKSTIKQPVEDEWDTPPDYASVVQTAKDALSKSFNKAHTFLFKR